MVAQRGGIPPSYPLDSRESDEPFRIGKERQKLSHDLARGACVLDCNVDQALNYHLKKKGLGFRV